VSHSFFLKLLKEDMCFSQVTEYRTMDHTRNKNKSYRYNYKQQPKKSG